MTSHFEMRLFWMRNAFRFGVVAVSLILAFSDWPVSSQTAQDRSNSSAAGCALQIHVDGLRNSVGNLGTVLFSKPDGWPFDPNKAFRRGPAPILPGQRHATAVWEDLPPGDYAVAAIHDENGNAKLDKNFLGIPKEGFGFANNPHVALSAPSFGVAIVHVTCPTTEINIHLQYK